MTALAVLFVASGILLFGLSIPLIRRKVPPNGWYGVRVRATLHDERTWYEANAYGGWCLLICGVIWTTCSVLFALVPGLTVDAYSLIMLAVLAVTVIPATILILRCVQRLQAQTARAGGEQDGNADSD